MRLLHTADWHLGHSLHGIAREYEHRCFLDWLLDTLREQQADALLIAGDVFDSANPPASAQAMFYGFIAEAQRRCPQLDIVIIGGNHDSPARLEAPRPLLHSLGVRVVGALPRSAGGCDPEPLLAPLRNRAGALAGWCAAVPFLRPLDLPPCDSEEDDPLILGVRRIYQQALTRARAGLERNQALIATGHCYMVGAALSELSERKILGGNQHALPAAIFPDDIGYVALGHLHLAQAVGRHEHIRYSGSPIPLSVSEASYTHQVVQVDFERGYCQAITALKIPRSVDILRVPNDGPRPLPEVERRLNALELPQLPPERQPFLEVSVLLEQPEPSLRRRIDACLEGKAARLLRIAPHYAGSGGALADAAPALQLQELTEEEVFRRRHRQAHGTEPSPELLAAFHELLAEAQGEPI